MVNFELDPVLSELVVSCPAAIPASEVASGDTVATIPEDTGPYGLNHGRIYYGSMFTTQNADTTESNGSGVDNTLTYGTYDRFVSENQTSCSVTYELSDTAARSTIDYVAVGAYALGEGDVVDITVEWSGSPGGSWIEIYDGPLRPDLNSGLYRIGSSVSAYGVRVTITGTFTYFHFARIQAGLELVMMRPHYSGLNPLSKSNNTTYSPQVSETGNFLGRQITRNGAMQQAAYKNLFKDWYNSEFYPFVKHARRYPYFYAWNLEEDTDGFDYGWTNKDVIGTNQGTRDYKSVSWDIEFYR